MPFRTVVVDSHSKLEYSLNYLVYRTIESTKRILLDEINTVIIQSTEVSITTSLLCELTKRKIKVLFCDEKKNPSSELIPCYGSHNSFERIRIQINWSQTNITKVWQRIVKEKIFNQSKLLNKRKKINEAILLESYANHVELNDSSNREGHAAKVYFNHVFFRGFNRDKECVLNNALDYGYTILLSQFNRIVSAAGYLTQLGIHHIGETNPFNLSCDLMEPFRIFVDQEALGIKEGDNFKSRMVALLSKDVYIDGKTQTITNAISIYCLSVFKTLETGNVSDIKFVEYNG